MLRIGTDLVEIAQVAASIAAFGDRYLSRVFTVGELEYCLGSHCHNPAPHLAARYAAKEATRKVIGSTDEPIAFRAIEVERHPDGSCDMLLHGSARTIASRLGLYALSVTMSHDGAYATAVVAGQAARFVSPTARLGRKTPRGAYER